MKKTTNILTRIFNMMLVIIVPLLSTGVTPVFAAEYPTKSIRLIVPFPPGGGTDIIARIIGQKLGDQFGQKVIIDNRGGAGGNVGAEIAAQAPPDGYTLFLGAATHAINVTLYSKLNYDFVKDFVAVSPIASMPYTMVCNPSMPFKSVQDLVRVAKEKPGQLNYASAGSGTGTHLAMEMFKAAMNINIVHIPYVGSAPAVTALLGGHVQVMVGNTASVLPQIEAGKLRALAVTSLGRLSRQPTLPSIAETVAPGFSAVQWYGVLAPARTPKEIVQKLNVSIANVVQSTEFKKRLFAEGAESMQYTPEQFATFIQSEIVQWAKAVRGAGARVD